MTYNPSDPGVEAAILTYTHNPYAAANTVSVTGTCDQLLSPGNLTIINTLSEADLNWDAVTGADSYTIYSSTDPYAAFPGSWTQEVSGLTELTWTDTNVSGSKKFYVVVAENSGKKNLFK